MAVIEIQSQIGGGFMKGMLSNLTKCLALLLLTSLLSVGTCGTVLADETPQTTSLNIKFVTGLSPAEQDAVVTQNGGVVKSSVPQLDLVTADFPSATLQDIIASLKADPSVVRVEVNKTRKVEAFPNDPYLLNQWTLLKIGWDQVYGVAAPAPGTNVKVAILDTGIDALHPDLDGKVVMGTSMLDASNGLSDPNGHGTWLAGIVAANTDNNEGIAGVAYAGVQMMPVKVIGANGEGQDSDIIAGVMWAADNDADVILMGFSNPGRSDSLQEAIDYAWSKNIIMVAAVGNDAQNAPTFPAGDRGVIGVSATDSNDNLAPFSNLGAAVFLAAPGVDTFSTDLNDSYLGMSGTSGSSAIVAGVAAFMRAMDPTLTNGVIVGRLARSADPAGTQDQTGNGRVNMERALADSSTDPIQPAGVDGGGGPFVGPYRIAAKNLTITFAGSGSGTVAISDTTNHVNDMNCTATCTDSTGNNDVGTLTATVTGGSFAGWSIQTSGITSCTGNTCNFSMGNSAQSVTVTFNKLNQTTPVTVTGPTDVTYGSTGTATANGGNGTGAYVFSAGSSTGCAVAGTTVSVTNASGSCSLTATRAADTNYNQSAPSAPFTVNLHKASQAALSLSVPVSITYGNTGTASTTGGNGTGAVTFSASGTGCTVNSSTGAISVTDASGTCSISASKAGDNNYNGPVADGPKLVTLNKAGQAPLTAIVTPSSVTYGNTATLSTSGGSGTGAVTFSAGSSTGCSVVGTTLSVTDASGTCSVTATKAADNNYNLATSAAASVTLQKASQVALTAIVTPSTVSYGNTAVLSTSGGSGTGAVTFSAGSSTGCSVAGTTLSVTNASGTCSVTATKAADNNYSATTSAAATVTLQKASQNISVATHAPVNATYNASFTVAATASSSLAVAYSSGSPSVCTNSGGTFTMVSGTGTCVVRYNQAGDGNYNAAAQVTENVTAQKASQTITVGTHAPATAGYNTSFTVAATASSSLAVAYSSGSPSVCTSSGATFTMVSGSGNCIVQYNQTGNTDYSAAPQATENVTAQKASQTISFTTAPPASAAYNSSFTVVAAATSGQAVSYSASGVCTNVAGVYTMTSGTGTCTVKVDQAGDANNYNVAPQLTQNVTAQKANATCTVTDYTVPYDGNFHTATGSCTGVNGEALSGPDLSATTHRDAGNYQDDWSFTDTTGNYNNHTSLPSENSHNKINPAAVTATAGSYSGMYDGFSHAPTACVVTGTYTDNLSCTNNPSSVGPNVGSGTITPSVGGANLNNFAVTAVNGSWSITAAGTTVTVSCPASVMYNGSAQTPCTATVTGAGGLNQSLPVSYVNNVNVGTATASASDLGDANHTGSSGSATFTIGQAGATCTVLGYTVFYDGNAHGATGSCTGVGGPSDFLTGLNLGETFINVPGGTANWTFSNANYTAQSGSVAIVITKAAQTITFGGLADKTAGDPAFTINASSSSGLLVSFSSLTPSTCSISDNVVTLTNLAGTCTIRASQDGDGNYDAAPDVDQSFRVLPGAAVTFSVAAPTSATAGDAFDLTVTAIDNFNNTATGYTGTVHFTTSDPSTLVMLPLDHPFVPSENGTFNFTRGVALDTAGPQTVTATDTSYPLISGKSNGIEVSAGAFTKLSVSAPAVAMAGTPISVTVTAQDNYGNTVPNYTDTVTLTSTDDKATLRGAYLFTTGSGGDNGSHIFDVTLGTAGSMTVSAADGAVSGTTGSILVIAGAAAKVRVETEADGSGNVVAARDVTASNSITVYAITRDAYDNFVANVAADAWSLQNITGDVANGDLVPSGDSKSAVFTGHRIGSAQIHATSGALETTDSGTITVIAGAASKLALNGLTGDLFSGTTRTLTATIQDSNGNTVTLGDDSTLSISFAQSAGSGSVTGLASVNASAGVATLTVTGNLAGSVTIGASASGSHGTLTAGSGNPITFNIITRSTTTAVSLSPSTLAYQESSNITVTVTDTDVETKAHPSGTVTITSSDSTDTFTGTCSLSPTATPGESTCSASVKAGAVGTGSHTITANFSATGIHSASSGSQALTVSKANATISVTPYNVTYDGDAHTATGSAKGVKGESLSGLDLSATTHTNAGDYKADAWTFTDVTGNYKDASGTVDDKITKANAVIVVTPYDVTYDANAYTATATAKGVKGESLSGLDLSGTIHTNAGDYTSDAWTFTDVTGNYNNDSGTTHDKIAKADPVVTATGGTFTYDGNVHAGSGSATGVKGEDLTPVNVAYKDGLGNLQTSAPVDAGSYQVAARYAGDTNYNQRQSAAVPLTINKADANITVNGYTGVYDGNPHGATGSATGVKGEDLSSLLHLGSSFTDVPGGTANWTFDGNTNYKAAGSTATIIINKADPTMTATGGTFTYDGNPHAGSGTATGVKGEPLTPVNVAYKDAAGNLLTSAPVDAATYSVAARYAGDANYNQKQSVAVPLVINQADANITVNGYTGTYDGNAHGATGTAKGAKDEDLSSLLHLGASFTNVPGGTATWTFDGNTNYKPASGTASITITKADPIVTATGNTCTYNGLPCTGSGSAKGVNSEDLTPVNVAYKDAAGTPLTSAPVNAGTYSVAARYAGDANYNQKQSAAAIITVNKQAASVTAEAKSRTYGDENSGLTATVAGTVNGDTLNYTLATTATMGSGVGFYPITVTLGLNPNYSVTKTDNTLTVSQRNATVTAEAKIKAYGDDNPAPTAIVVGTANGDTLNYTLATTAANGSAVGSYPITVTLGVNPNYNVTKTDGTLTITPRQITVTADAKPKWLGAPDPPLTYQITSGNLVNGDSFTGALARVAGENIGSYAIQQGTLALSGNYALTYVPANLTITTTGFIIPIEVTLHTVDQKKSGVCGTEPNGKPRGECKGAPGQVMLVKVFDLKDLSFQAKYGKSPSNIIYDDIYENVLIAPNAICTTDAIYGEGLCSVTKVSDYLVLVKYTGPANIKFPSSKTVNLYAGKKINAGSFQSNPTNTEFVGPLKAVRPTGALWARDADIHLGFHILRTINRHNDERNEKDGRCDYGDGNKSVYLGSYLEILYPGYTVWEEGVTDYVYPFILTGDTDWAVDVCTAVPLGYKIVGVYDIDGNLITTNNCVQAGVAGETKVIAFEVLDLQSPPPHLSAKLKIRHKGQDRIDQFEVNGYRKGKDKKVK